MKLLTELETLTEGNIGAIVVLTKMVQHVQVPLDEMIQHLQELNLRAELIWIAYHYYCKDNIYDFIESVRMHDANMLKFIKDTFCFTRETNI